MKGIYIIMLREFIKCNENVYKIGKSKKLFERIKDYPKNSKVEFLYECKDYNNAERNIINHFDNNFIKRKDYGNEYYEGELNKMIEYIEKNINGRIINYDDYVDTNDIDINNYECNICNSKFKYKSLLEKHLNRKIPCNIKEIIKNSDDIEIVKKEYNYSVNKITKCNKKTINNTCGFCKSKFANKRNLENHISSVCKIKKKYLIEAELIKLKYNLLKEKNKNTINEDDNDVVICNNNVDNNVDTTNIININDYGNENLSYITMENYIDYLKNINEGFFEYIKTIYFNKNEPYNHNILLTGENTKFIKVYKEGNFIREIKSEIIQEILNKNLLRLENKILELTNNIDENILVEFDKFKTDFNKNIKIYKNKILCMLLNNKDIVIDTHNKK